MGFTGRLEDGLWQSTLCTSAWKYQFLATKPPTSNWKYMVVEKGVHSSVWIGFIVICPDIVVFFVFLYEFAGAMTLFFGQSHPLRDFFRDPPRTWEPPCHVRFPYHSQVAGGPTCFFRSLQNFPWGSLPEFESLEMEVKGRSLLLNHLYGWLS